jgi:hypothetical protein
MQALLVGTLSYLNIASTPAVALAGVDLVLTKHSCYSLRLA